jgi:phenylalanine-4-hydroxylase
MTELTHAKLPPHLLKYVVEQNYARYTPEDQAVWRHILRQLKDFLSKHAHESYLGGLEKTGITIDRIPEIENIDQKLNAFGWGAVPVSGFIPPAAFMEFQAAGVLPIASDMRTLDHLLYTPAPDIVHEAAGHAPIIANPEYAEYLRQYGEVARHSIISRQDMDQYEAIRVLSDIKEDPRSTKDEIARAERRLQEINESLTAVSEAALLSRMNWWTAEYGLIGDLKNPKIFGAGLLSSVGESKNCLQDSVKKIPLSVDCVNYSYDITEQQPQLFVAKDFTHLGAVLEDLALRLSYRRGGLFGLDRAIEAATVNTVELDSGLQISGVLKSYVLAGEKPAYLRFAGPCQLALNKQELPGQGIKRHPQGFSTPLGSLRNHRRPLSAYSEGDLRNLALTRGERARLQFESGVLVEGILENWLYHGGKLVLMTWKDCKVSLEGEILFDPAWGVYDMAVGSEIASVFGGPADRGAFGETDDFANKRVPARSFTAEEKERFALFQDIRDLRENGAATPAKWQKLAKKFLSSPSMPWLAGSELMEIARSLELPDSETAPLLGRLNP